MRADSSRLSPWPPLGRWVSASLLGALVLMSALPVAAQQMGGECGAISNAYGPYDYRTDKDKLGVVEAFHFTAEVEQLIRPKSGYLGSDIDYTLRAFPNHHRALLSLMRYGQRLKTEHIPNTNYSVRCYFVRALTFKADDTTVRMLFATYLNSQKQKEDALKQLEFAKSLAGENAFTHYNIGLLYADLGDYGRALEQAHAAMALGFTRTELKNRLVAAKRWAEPASSPP